MVWQGHCWVAPMFYQSGFLPSNSQRARFHVFESYSRPPDIWSPRLSSCVFAFIWKQSQKGHFKRDDGFRSIPLCFLYRTAAVCEQYFSQVKEKSYFYLKNNSHHWRCMRTDGRRKRMITETGANRDCTLVAGVVAQTMWPCLFVQWSGVKTIR